MKPVHSLFLAALAATIGAAPTKALVYDEAVSGDLSGDRLNPNAFTLSPGTNSIKATSNTGDREYVALTVPAGQQLSSVVPFSYAGTDTTAFIGVQSGSTFTEPPTGTDVTKLLGYAHFGPGPGNVGQDILPTIGTGSGAIGFLPPLPAGTYTFWMQQTGAALVTYQMNFNVTPEPASLTLLLASGAVLFRRPRPRSRLWKSLATG